MILFGEGALRTTTSQFVSHYLKERNHQGLANRIINPDRAAARRQAQLSGSRVWAGF